MKKPSELTLITSNDEKSNDLLTPTIVLTNQEALSVSNSPDQLVKSPILYENDFDLYILLKDMLNGKLKLKREKKQTLTPFKNYTKSLTAHFNEYHECDGKNEWGLTQNGYDMYSKKISCIGTDPNDFDYGDPVSLDLQPLSTRIKLMCKLVIIIQGACLERSGPPKLVQDRCVQFDGENSSNAETHLMTNKLPIIKSNSCEDLLDLTEEQEVKKQPNEIKITIFSSNSQPVKRANSIKRNSSIKRTNSIKSRPIVETTGAVSDDECIDSYTYHHEMKNLDNNITTTTKISKSKRCSDIIENSILSNNCDLEHYFKYRISKFSKNDYASAPYYQYSSSKEMHSQDKSTNTKDSKADNKKATSTTSISTSTEDLLNDYKIGYFSKYQLLSSDTLYNKKTTLKNSDLTESNEIDLMSCLSSIPITINVKNKQEAKIKENNAKTFVYSFNIKNSNSSNPLCSESEISIKIPTAKARRTLISSDEEDEQLALLKAGPKRSSEWSLFKNQKNLIKSITTTTTTTTTIVEEKSSEIE